MATLGSTAYGEGEEGNGGGRYLTRLRMTEDGTVTDIASFITSYAGTVNYYMVIYRGTVSGPTTLAYASSLISGATANTIASHTLSSSITAVTDEYLWAGVVGAGQSYKSDAGGVDYIDPSAAVPADALAGSLDSGWSYSTQLTYTPSGGGGDTTPDTFTFTDITNAVLSTDYTSNTITVTGIDTASAISITGGTYRINGGSFTASAGTVVVSDTVEVKVTSSGSNSTAVNATLTIGGVSDTYTVTTLAASATVDSYPATVRSGDTGVAYTTTGLSTVSSITIGTLAGTSISDTSGDGTHSIPALSDGVAHELYGTKTVTITGTGGAPTTSTSFQPLSTQSFVTLSGTLNTTDTGVLYNFSPAAAVGDQIVWITANGTVDAQGNYSGDFVGTQTMWHIDATDNVARSYSVITGVGTKILKYWNGSAWVEKPLKYWNGSAWVAKTIKYWNGSAWT